MHTLKLCKVGEAGSTLYFAAQLGEIHYTLRYGTAKEFARFHEYALDQKMDVRRYMATPMDLASRDKFSYVEITIPAVREAHAYPIVIFTDWDAFLMSDTGKTIDRLYRRPEAD